MIRSVRYKEVPVECGRGCFIDRDGCSILDGSDSGCDGGGGSCVGLAEERKKEQGNGDTVCCVRRRETVLVMVRSDGCSLR